VSAVQFVMTDGPSHLYVRAEKLRWNSLFLAPTAAQFAVDC